jgi:hypothetical protein
MHEAESTMFSVSTPKRIGLDKIDPLGGLKPSGHHQVVFS